MTREEHRAVAEQLLRMEIESPEEGQLLMARALVHALLALSAPEDAAHLPAGLVSRLETLAAEDGLTVDELVTRTVTDRLAERLAGVMRS